VLTWNKKRNRLAHRLRENVDIESSLPARLKVATRAKHEGGMPLAARNPHVAVPLGHAETRISGGRGGGVGGGMGGTSLGCTASEKTNLGKIRPSENAMSFFRTCVPGGGSSVRLTLTSESVNGVRSKRAFWAAENPQNKTTPLKRAATNTSREQHGSVAHPV